LRDTIAAIATPTGAGGIGIVRLSGPSAAQIAERLVGRAELEDRRLVRAVARDPESGERLDEVLVAVMRAPRTYTGEDVAEIHGHGGRLNHILSDRHVGAASGCRQTSRRQQTRENSGTHTDS